MKSLQRKRKAQIDHALRRLRERFDIHLSEEQLHEVGARIRNGECEHLGRDSHRCARYRVSIQGKTVDVVYDRMRKTIVTAVGGFERRSF